MSRSRLAIMAPFLGCILLVGCKGTKDSELRWYVRGELRPYLDSLTYQLCAIKAAAAPAAPGRNICHGPPEGYKPPPPNGKP